MNLHGLASGVIPVVNPLISVVHSTSTGYTTDAAGARTPTYSTAAIKIQFQGISEKDLKQIAGLNLGGILRKVYSNGVCKSIDRKTGAGGDKFTISGDTWLVVHVLEQWPDWSSVVVQKQVD